MSQNTEQRIAQLEREVTELRAALLRVGDVLAKHGENAAVKVTTYVKCQDDLWNAQFTFNEQVVEQIGLVVERVAVKPTNLFVKMPGPLAKLRALLNLR